MSTNDDKEIILPLRHYPGVHIVVTEPGTTPALETQQLADLFYKCYRLADEMGWHDQPRSWLEVSMLIVTEAAELAEWARHGASAQSDHIPEFSGAEEELADIIIRVGDHALEKGIKAERLAACVFAKLEFNRTRGYKHGGKTI